MPSSIGSHDYPTKHRTGSQLILATKPFASEFSGRSWWCVLSTGVLLFAALASTIYASHLSLKLGSSVLTGLLILRFFVIYHDQQHHAILNRSRAAELLMRIFGIYSLSPSSVWRSSHNHHHKHNSKLRGSHIGSFPIMTADQFLNSSRAKRFGYLFARHPLTILFGYIFIFVFGMCINPVLKDWRVHFDCALALVLHVVIGVTLFVSLGWQGLIFTQTIPHFIAYALGGYLFYAQHNFPGVRFREKNGWTYEGAALDSSSFMRGSPIMAWFTANIGFHHVHHLNARIPFYRLPEAHAAIPELQAAKVTTLSPIQIYRCLRLKVWDVEAQQMIPLRSVWARSAAKAIK